MATRKNVPASAVRTWAATPEGTKALTDAGAKFPGKRGRLDASTVNVFHKANKRVRYEVASEAEKPTITVKVPAKDSRGRNRTKVVTLTTEEARAALGHPKGKRGRFNMTELAEALAKREAAKA